MDTLPCPVRYRMDSASHATGPACRAAVVILGDRERGLDQT
jgi:hypothetical protein